MHSVHGWCEYYTVVKRLINYHHHHLHRTLMRAHSLEMDKVQLNPPALDGGEGTTGGVWSGGHYSTILTEAAG